MSDGDHVRLAQGRLGAVLRGKYRLDRILGIGGMAVVYAATHRNTKRSAIKMLHPELSQLSEVRDRFLREGYLANSVGHPGAVTVHDDDIAEDGTAFVVMDLLEGSPLDEIWQRYGMHVPVELVVAIGDALLDVLVAAHAKAITHRDIKPANLFLTNDGQLKVLDFGIARLHDGKGTETQAGLAMGTPAFMAPEQARGETDEVQAQSDLWSVGATLFALVTGELVHTGDNAQQVLLSAGTRKAPALSSVAPQVPGAIAAVIDRALAFEKADRWPDALHMQQALRQACLEATGKPVPGLPTTAGESARLDRTLEGMTSTPARSGGSPGTEPTELAKSLDPGSLRQWSSAPWRGLSVALAVCVLIAGGAAVLRAVYGPHVHYCLGLEYVRGGPECRYEVPAGSLRNRSGIVHRVTEVRGKTTLVENVNFAGFPHEAEDEGDPTQTPNPLPPVDDETTYARMEVTRDASGQVTDLKKFSTWGSNLEWQKWSDGAQRVDLVDIDGRTPRQYVHEGYNERSTTRARFTSLRVEYDAQGRRARVYYLDWDGRPRPGPSGTFGIAFEYGRMPGTAIRTTNVGADGQPMPDSRGVTSTVRSDDGQAWSDVRYFGLDGGAVAPGGVHGWHVEQSGGQLEAASASGLSDEPAVLLSSGFHEARFTWNPDNRQGTRSFWDERRQPVLVRGDLLASVRLTYDQRGRWVCGEFLDTQGNRTMAGLGTYGCAGFRVGYDELDREVFDEAFDPAGSLIVTHWGGVARVEMKTDAHNNDLEVRFFDEKHRPFGQRVPAVERSEFDERDLRVRIEARNSEDQPALLTLGHSSCQMKYDRHRNPTEWAAFGVDGKPTFTSKGYATVRATFDDHDDLVALSYFDAAGALTPIHSSYAIQRFKSDVRSLVIEDSFFDNHENPALGEDGYSSVKKTRDRNGDVIEESFLGKRGEPIARKGGFARRTTRYDMMRRPTEVALFDVMGKPVVGSGGWSVERTTYDWRGLATRIDHFDTHGSPILDRQGRASVIQTYDGMGSLVEESSLGVDGGPVLGSEGYAAKKTAYNDRFELTQEALFGVKGEPIAGKGGWSVRRLDYDERGNNIGESFFDASQGPIVPAGLSYAAKKQRFDDQYWVVETAYFDVQGAPTAGPDGAAKVRFAPDKYGRVLTTRYFDENDQPAPCKGGKVVVESTYDDLGRLIGERFVDANGLPRAAADGCFGHHTTYDALGHAIEESCVGEKGEPMASRVGWAIRRTVHDAFGDDVTLSTYAANGSSLQADREGIARRRSVYDERHRLTETRFFDASDKPTHDDRGAYSVRIAYDDDGDKTDESLWDEQDQPVDKASSVRSHRSATR